MRKTTLLLAIISIYGITIHCSKAPVTYTEEIIDGVRHVHNISPLWVDEERIELEFVQKIGELEGDDENYQFYVPMDVERDKEGNIYILDYGNCRVQKFDPEGNYLATIGSKGQGPGEFNNPYDLEIDNEGNIYVYNQPMKIHKFSNSGGFIQQYTIQSQFFEFEVLRSSYLVYSNPRYSDGKKLVTIIDNEGNHIKEFGIPVKPASNSDLGGLNFIFMDIDSDDNIIIQFMSQNRIEKYDCTGNIVHKMDKELDYEIVYLEKTLNRQIRNKRISAPIMEYTIISSLMGIDSKDRIWEYFNKKQRSEDVKIEDVDPDEYTEFRLYDKNGIYLTQVAVSTVKRGKFIIKDDRLYSIVNDDMCVYEYRIVEK